MSLAPGKAHRDAEPGGLGGAGEITLRRCRSARDWRLFERVPEILHGDDPLFVPPVPGDTAGLRKPDHVFHGIGSLRSYVAFRDGEPVGRIASIVNGVHNEFHGDRTGFFGFASFQDEAVAAALLRRVRADLVEAGMDRMRGPFDPTQNDECGVLIEGFHERPCFGMPWNPAWYGEVYDRLGLERGMDLLAYSMAPEKWDRFAERFEPLVEKLRRRLPLTVRPVRPDRLDEEVALITRLFTESLREEWNFMPLTPAQARSFAEDLADHLDPEGILIAEVDGEPAGLSLGFPDVNEHLARVKRLPRWLRLPALWWLLKTRRFRGGRWAVFGVLEEHRRKGGTLLLIYESLRRSRHKYETGEISWTQARNREVNALAGQFGLEPSKRYRIYEAPLDP